MDARTIIHNRLFAHSKHVIARERQKVTEKVRERLGPLIDAACLETYKKSLFNLDSEAAIDGLRQLERTIEEGINTIRDYIREASLEKSALEDKVERLWKSRLKQNHSKQQIARDLHDTVLQDLTTLLFELQYCQKLCTMNCTKALDEYPSLRNLLSDLKQSMHDFTASSDSDDTECQLVPQVKGFAKRISEISGTEIDTFVRGKQNELPAEMKNNLLQILKEALINVQKHAEAEKVKIILKCARDQVSLLISDDGKGFVFKDNQDVFFGIRGMRERAEILGGTLNIFTNPGAGTTVSVDAPISKAESYEQCS